MTITFNTNLSALTSQRYISNASTAASSSLAKLSSGSRIPQAKDDAAGLAIGSKLRAEVAGLTQASNNAAQATSLLQIADGALSTIGDILVRMKTLATQSSSGQLGDAERSLLNQEYGNLNSEIDRVALTANFNGTSLLAGSTIVTANQNHISSVGTASAIDGTTVGDAVNKQISQGVASIKFNSTASTNAVKFEYDAANSSATMTDLTSGKTETVSVSANAIALGANETLSFGTIGATVTLDSNFDKSVSTSLTNGVRKDSYATANGGGGHVSTTAGLSSISEFRLKPNGAGGVSASNFNGVVFTITGAGSTDSASSTITATVTGDDGASHSFSVKNASTGSTGGTVDLSTAGAKTVTLVDSSGNEVDLSFTMTAAQGNSNTSTITATVAGLNSSKVDVASASSVTFAAPTVVAGNGTSPTATGTNISSVSFGGLNPPTLASINGAVGTVNVTTPTAATASITFGGHTFTSTASVDMNTVGATATFAMSDGQGNTFNLNITGNGGTWGTTSTITLGAATATAPAVQDSSIRLLAVSKTSTSTFDFGSIDRAKVAFTTTSAASSSATLTLGDGSTFTASGINLATTGVKTITLAGQGANAGASITYSFNLTHAAANGDVVQTDIGELGQMVGVNSTTGGSTSFSFKVGTGTTSNDSITFSLNSATTSALGLSSSTVSTAANADTAIAALNVAISAVSSRRADVGANQSRLGFASSSISVAIENTTAATSAIMDVDVSSEITNFTSKQVLLQAGISLLAQANQQPSLLLKLLQ